MTDKDHSSCAGEFEDIRMEVSGPNICGIDVVSLNQYSVCPICGFIDHVKIVEPDARFYKPDSVPELDPAEFTPAIL